MMDPITTAIVTTVASSLSKEAITDSYNPLKAAIKKKFGDKSDLVNAVDGRDVYRIPFCKIS